MEPDKLKQYMVLKDRCTDIATAIFPHNKEFEGNVSRR